MQGHARRPVSRNCAVPHTLEPSRCARCVQNTASRTNRHGRQCQASSRSGLRTPMFPAHWCDGIRTSPPSQSAESCKFAEDPTAVAYCSADLLGLTRLPIGYFGASTGAAAALRAAAELPDVVGEVVSPDERPDLAAAWLGGCPSAGAADRRRARHGGPRPQPCGLRCGKTRTAPTDVCNRAPCLCGETTAVVRLAADYVRPLSV